MDSDPLPLLGPARTIDYAVDAQGRRHARDFLHEKCPTKDAKSIFHKCRVMAEHGAQGLQREAFKHEAGEIFAFKSFQARVAAFQQGKTWFLTHGFIKKKDKWPPAELTRAERIRLEHLSRRGGP